MSRRYAVDLACGHTTYWSSPYISPQVGHEVWCLRCRVYSRATHQETRWAAACNQECGWEWGSNRRRDVIKWAKRHADRSGHSVTVSHMQTFFLVDPDETLPGLA